MFIAPGTIIHIYSKIILNSYHVRIRRLSLMPLCECIQIWLHNEKFSWKVRNMKWNGAKDKKDDHEMDAQNLSRGQVFRLKTVLEHCCLTAGFWQWQIRAQVQGKRAGIDSPNATNVLRDSSGSHSPRTIIIATKIGLFLWLILLLLVVTWGTGCNIRPHTLSFLPARSGSSLI